MKKGNVITWGAPDAGGDSSNVKQQLQNIKKIYSNTYAFVAIDNNGKIITWGSFTDGGNSSSVQHLLNKC
jgi:hypothetical protein